ncbi:MAG: reverse transcriptase-like protein [Desulfobacteraceae bacterium]|jgi:probable phosphoglycerate mutase
MIKLTITCDGGSIRNGDPDSIGYGSYIVSHDKGRTKQKPLSFAAGTTNNEAEYMTLIAALSEIKESFEHVGYSANDIQLTIRVDSQLIIGQLMKGWRVKAVNLRPLVAKAGALVDAFNKVSFEQISGDEMKSILHH